MLVTIIADASFCPHTKAAGYSAWIATNRGKARVGEPIQVKVDNPKTAEMMGMAMAVEAGLKQGLIEPFDVILLQCDCLFGLQTFGQTRRVDTDQEQSVVNYFYQMRDLNNLRFQYKHVRGHVANGDTRHMVNEICDEHAKEHMRKMRKKFNYQAKKAKRNANKAGYKETASRELERMRRLLKSSDRIADIEERTEKHINEQNQNSIADDESGTHDYESNYECIYFGHF